MNCTRSFLKKVLHPGSSNETTCRPFAPCCICRRCHTCIFCQHRGPGLAQDLPRLPRAQQAAFSWDELAAHAGLAGIGAKMKDQFKLDVVFDRGRYASAIKAAISLSEKEWE